MTIREGGCLCGAVRYRVVDEPSARGICHCETCRRTASAAALPFCTFNRADVLTLRGNPAAFRSSPHVVRRFCGACGSPLTYVNDEEPDKIDVMTCSFDDPDQLTPEFSVWTSETLPWDQPNATCPAFPRTRAEGSDT